MTDYGGCGWVARGGVGAGGRTGSNSLGLIDKPFYRAANEYYRRVGYTYTGVTCSNTLTYVETIFGTPVD